MEKAPISAPNEFLAWLASPRVAVFQFAGLTLGLGLLLLPVPESGGPVIRLAILLLLALLSLCALVAAWMRRASTLVRLGFLVAHGAPVLLLAGLAWNRFAAVEHRYPLSLGVEQTVADGLRVRLDELRPVLGPAEFRLLAFLQPDGKGGFEAEPKVLGVRSGMRGRLSLGGFRFEAERLLTDALDRGHFAESPTAELDPALQVVLGLGLPEPLSSQLFARSEPGCRQDEPRGRFAVLYQETFSSELLGRLRPRPPREEILQLQRPGQVVSHSLRGGEAWEQPEFSVKVLKRLPDFFVQTRADGTPEPGSRSLEPKDPWLQLELDLKDGQRRRLLLSARDPELTYRLNAPHLPPEWRFRYVRDGEETQRRFVVLTRADRQARLIESGRVLRSEPFELGKPFVVAAGLSVTPVAALERPVYVPEFVPNPDPPKAETTRPERAVLRLRLIDPDSGRSEVQWLEATGGPVLFFEGRVACVFRPAPTVPKFQARLNVRDASGQALAQGPLGTDRVMEVAGNRFQLTEGPDPQLRLIREPGAPLVRWATLLMGLGVLWMLRVKPWLKRRNQAGEAA